VQPQQAAVAGHPTGTLFLPKDASGKTFINPFDPAKEECLPSSDPEVIAKWKNIFGSKLVLAPIIPETRPVPAPKRTTLVGEGISTTKKRATRINLEDNTFRYMRWYDEPLRDEYRNKKLKFEPDLFLWRMFLKGLAYKTGGWLDFEYDYLVEKACINPNNIVAVARFKKHLLKTILYDFEIVKNADGSKELYSQAVADARVKADAGYNRKSKPKGKKENEN